MCVILLVLFAFYVLALLVLAVLALAAGATAGRVVGAVVEAVRGLRLAPLSERKLGAYRGAISGGCLGAVLGLLVAAGVVWLGLAALYG